MLKKFNGEKIMTPLEYMQKQVQKHRETYKRELARGASLDVLCNIETKIEYYEEACKALDIVRCEDCIHMDEHKGIRYCFKWNDVLRPNMKFCSDGERREK